MISWNAKVCERIRNGFGSTVNPQCLARAPVKPRMVRDPRANCRDTALSLMHPRAMQTAECPDLACPRALPWPLGNAERDVVTDSDVWFDCIRLELPALPLPLCTASALLIFRFFYKLSRNNVHSKLLKLHERTPTLQIVKLAVFCRGFSR